MSGKFAEPSPAPSPSPSSASSASFDESAILAAVALGKQSKPWHENNSGTMTLSNRGNKKKIKDAKSVLRAGIPDEHRAVKWKALVHASGLVDYELRFDLGLRRAFGDARLSNPQVPLFGSPPVFSELQLNHKGQQIAHEIMCIVGSDFPQLSFCPFVAPIVTVLLHYMDEDGAMSTIIGMIKESVAAADWHYFPCSSRETQLFAFVFVDTAKRAVPALWQRIKQLTNRTGKVKWQPFWMDLLSTFFVRAIPLQFVFLIMDSFCLEGCKMLFRIGLGILGVLEGELLQQDSLDKMNAIILQRLKSLNEDTFAEIFNKGLSYSIQRQDFMTSRQKNEPFLSKVENEQATASNYLKALPELSSKSSFITPDMLHELWKWVPSKIRNNDLDLVFNTATDGYALSHLLEKCGTREPLFLFIKTTKGEIFGMFISEAFSKRPKDKRFYGTGESYIFTLSPQMEVWPWAKMDREFMKADRDKYGTGQAVKYLTVEANSYFIKTTETGINVGAGAFAFDSDFRNGVTGKSDTFNSPPLISGFGTFECASVEVYAVSK